ncbi:hypothetical protein CQW23_14757 [Capsicum baccatum]|uniref:Geraniol 8-hydroxylase n=1 Tax=Capsicum baccatum TaxID=33114 RepID=A0A2G2WK99_CAPBA|nr:hypothetical protein CQW23_14757 [Capsicum baccatum]
MELPILLLCIFCWFFIKPLILNSKSSRKLPPGPTGFPIIGSLLELGSKPNRSLAELAKIHGPLMTLKLGSITTVIASSPETAKEILQKHAKIFSARTVFNAAASQPNPEATIAWVPPDNMWRNKRRICNTQMLTNQRLDSLQELRHQMAETTSSRTIFSIDLVDPESEKGAQEFNDLVRRIMEDSGKPNLSDSSAKVARFARSEASYKASVFKDLIIGGSDTSAITTEWAMSELLRKPNELNKVRQEIIQQIGIERPVKESDMDKLPFLRAVVKETLRLHPADPLLFTTQSPKQRRSVGLHRAQGHSSLVNAWAIGRNPKYWVRPPECLKDLSNLVWIIKLPKGMAPENLDMEEEFGVTLRKAIPLVAIPSME